MIVFVHLKAAQPISSQAFSGGGRSLSVPQRLHDAQQLFWHSGNRFSGTDQRIKEVELLTLQLTLQQMQMWVSAQNVVAVLKPVRTESVCEPTAANLFICLEKQLSNLLSLA